MGAENMYLRLQIASTSTNSNANWMLLAIAHDYDYRHKKSKHNSAGHTLSNGIEILDVECDITHSVCWLQIIKY